MEGSSTSDSENEEITQRNELEKIYFVKGYTHKEILACLLGIHNIHLSLRQLKRDLKKMSLFRRMALPNGLLQELVTNELLGSGSNLGYRSMQSKIFLEHGLNFGREQVRKALRDIDPEGVELRLRHRLRRRKYINKGPNFTWHMDGYDKLKPYGFSIHGCMDGFSRKIMWLHVGPTNNDPSVILRYYLDCIEEIKGLPKRIRADFGTENVTVATIQRFLRYEHDDTFAKEKSFIFGKSTSNQRIEAWWSKLRGYTSSYWMDFFKNMVDEGTLDTSDPCSSECARFCFNRLIQKDLDTVKKIHNNHRIRPYHNQECPSGKPNIMYDIPEAYDTENFKVEFEDDELEIARGLETRLGPYGCTSEFLQIIFLLFDNDVPSPESPADAYRLYLEIMQEIHDIDDS